MPVGRRGVQPAGGVAQRGREDQPDRDRLPVPDPVRLPALDRVRQRVAVVEVLALAGLAQVAGHHPGLDPDRPLDQLAGRRGRAGPLQQVEDRRVGDEAALDHLGQPGPVVPRRQRGQRGQVAEHAGRRVEGADQVFAGRGVDGGLAADRGVDHAEQGGGQVHHPDAAQPGGGDPAGEVGGGAAAEADHRVGPGEAGGAERLPAVAGHRERLGRLAVRDRQRQHGQPGRAQPVGDRGGAVPQGRLVHQRDLGRPGQQRRQLAVQVAADHDVVPARPPGSAADRHPHRIPADTGRPRSGRRPGGRRRPRTPVTAGPRSAGPRSAGPRRWRPRPVRRPAGRRGAGRPGRRGRRRRPAPG